MLELLEATDRMLSTLFDVDAPIRQLTGVVEWRDEIATAVSIGSRYPRPKGLTINDEARWTYRGWRRPSEVSFIYGRATHAAWRALTNAIVDKLHVQAMHAEEIAEGWAEIRDTAVYSAAASRANKQMHLAIEWWRAAHDAEASGRALIETEDAIQVPVGRALARVGRHEVAQDKHYHQRRMPR